MIVSLNWIKKYADITLSQNELIDRISSRLVEVEDVEDLGSKYADALIVQVKSVEKMPGSDHLHICEVDDNKKRKGVDRLENGYIQVVCGASNVKAGMLTVWLPPEAIVPSTYNDPTPFKLAAKPLRGVVSNGMLASAEELALFEDHSGIIELDKGKAGDSFAAVYELNDLLIHIENKSLTHRPDTFGIIGFAREVSAIQGRRFLTADFMKLSDIKYEDKLAAVKVEIDNPALSSQYSAIVLEVGSHQAKTPLEVQTYLARVGVRPINPIVDVSNYLMMLTGQPMHTFDYDKVAALCNGKPEIHVRLARKNEKLILLDKSEIVLDQDDIVISAGETAVALAGAMGALNTAIDKDTKRILLESATFNLYNMRSTQMRHGVFSEAITRFTKGQPAALCLPVLHEAVRLLKEWAGAEAISSVSTVSSGDSTNKAVVLDTDFINSRLGSMLEVDEIIKILENAEFKVDNKLAKLKITAPFWRSDIHIAEDVVEEVGRLYGFDNIKPTLPMRNMKAVSAEAFDEFKFNTRRILQRSGANEVYSYSFVHGDLLEKSQQSSKNSYRITNAISPELQYYRQSLLPSLLNITQPNLKQGYDEFAVYEMNKVHAKHYGMDGEKVPREADSLALVIAKKQSRYATYFDAKKILEFLLGQLGVEYDIVELTGTEDPASLPFDIKRSAMVISQNRTIGIVGEFKNSVKSAFKLPDTVAGFELDTRELFISTGPVGEGYRPLSKYPKTDRDVCFRVAAHQTYGSIMFVLKQAAKDLSVRVDFEPIDIYQAEDAKSKNITIKMIFEPVEKTLTSDETNQIADQLSQAVVNVCKASIV